MEKKKAERCRTVQPEMRKSLQVTNAIGKISVRAGCMVPVMVDLEIRESEMSDVGRVLPACF